MREHWPEYLIEACGLAFFMISASLFGSVLEYPGSAVRRMLEDPLERRALMGMAMGLTSIAIVYSPWGMRSGAHINPAVTLAFWRLGRVRGADALCYVASQFAGGAAGMALSSLALRGALADPAVRYVVTTPGPRGEAVAFAAELAISFGLMLGVLVVSNARRLARYTGAVAGALVALYIAVEAPISGMSMNPARSFASALAGNTWDGFWIYLFAPPLAMLAAAEVYVKARGSLKVRCAKLHHENAQRCIFLCNYATAA